MAPALFRYQLTPHPRPLHAERFQVFHQNEVCRVACAELTDNLSYASMPPEDIRAMALRVAAAKPDAIVAWCTNLMAAPLARAIEKETGIVLLDSAALVVWHMLAMLGLDTPRASAWGRLMALRPRGASAARSCTADQVARPL